MARFKLTESLFCIRLQGTWTWSVATKKKEIKIYICIRLESAKETRTRTHTHTHTHTSIDIQKCVKAASLGQSVQYFNLFLFQLRYSFSIAYVKAMFVLFLLFFVVLLAFSWFFFLNANHIERCVRRVVVFFAGRKWEISEQFFHTLFSFAYIIILSLEEDQTTKYGVCSYISAGCFFPLLILSFLSTRAHTMRYRCTYEIRLLCWVKWACRIWHQYFYMQTLPKVGSCTKLLSVCVKKCRHR